MNIFKQYRDYLVNYNISIVALQSLKQKNASFKQLVNRFQRAQMRTSRLSLESFLIMPVQRIPRYLLLLADIKKYTATTHPDFEFLTLANDTLKGTLQSHNSNIDPKASKYAQKLLSVSSSIENVEAIPEKYTQGSLVQSGRRLLREGRLSFRRAKAKPTERYCFVFNDIILICNEKSKGDEHPFVFTDVLPMKGTKISSEATKGIKLANNDSTWDLKFCDNKTRENWLSAFKS